MNNEKRFVQASTILFILNLLASALNYLCQLLLARVLSVESYGTVNTIFSLMMIVAVPGSTLTMIVAKYYASASGDDGKRHFLSRQTQNALVLTVVVILGMLLLRKALTDTLTISDNVVLFMAILLSALGFFQPLYSGVFSGKKRFILVGVYSLFIPAYKIISIVCARSITQEDRERLYIVLGVMIVGVVVTAAYGCLKAYSVVGKDSTSALHQKNVYSVEDVRILVLNLSLMLYMNIDLLCVRRYGDELESGLYSSVLLFGRLIYYLSTTIGTVLLPSVAGDDVSDKERLKLLNKSLLVMVAFAFLSLIPLNVFKEFFIKLLFGKEYIEASKYVIYISIISLSLSIYTILVNYVVGVGRTRYIVPIMVIVDCLLIASGMYFKSISAILISISVLGVVGATLVYMLGVRKKFYARM